MMEHYFRGEVEKAAKIHRDLLPLVRALFIESNPAPVKYALNYLGAAVGMPRLPLTEPSEKSKALIRDTLAQYKIDLSIT